eukprot:SAG25_NODE_213_length_11711_cov_8.330348_10_plen_136_part_00
MQASALINNGEARANGGVSYTPLFSAKGFRYAALSLHPPSTPIRTLSGPRVDSDQSMDESFSFTWRPTLKTLTSHFIHTDVTPVGNVTLPEVSAQGDGTYGTADILNKIHRATRYSALANLFSIPTDCPQRCVPW